MTYQTEYVKASKDAVRARGSRSWRENQKSTRNSNRVDFWFSFEAPVERALGNPEHPADFLDRDGFFLVKRARKLNLRFIHQARAPTLASPVGGGFEPGDRALADELALELRERRKT